MYSFLEPGSVSQNVIVPANAPALSIYLEFPEEIEIDHAIFESGFLSFAIQNPSAAAITSSNLRVPGIRKPDGSELVIESNVAAFSSDSIVYNLIKSSYTLPTTNRLKIRIACS